MRKTLYEIRYSPENYWTGALVEREEQAKEIVAEIQRRLPGLTEVSYEPVTVFIDDTSVVAAHCISEWDAIGVLDLDDYAPEAPEEEDDTNFIYAWREKVRTP